MVLGNGSRAVDGRAASSVDLARSTPHKRIHTSNLGFRKPARCIQ